MKKLFYFLFLNFFQLSFGQFDTVQDSLDNEQNYRKYYDCKYEKGNVLVIQKKGQPLEVEKNFKFSKNGLVIRMEAIYDLEFIDGKRFRSGVIKEIGDDYLTITSTMNERAAQYEGIKYEIFKYPIKDIKMVRFISDRLLGLFKRLKISNSYDVFTKSVEKAKLCPAVLTFPKRNNEVKVCHYYLTSQGYDLLFETDGFIDYMEYSVDWN